MGSQPFSFIIFMASASLPSKICWGFVFTRLSEGVYRMQLSRSDHPPCDFRRGLVGLGNVPFKRCASRDKVKLPTTKARKRKRS